jgi:hypothetical protein
VKEVGHWPRRQSRGTLGVEDARGRASGGRSEGWRTGIGRASEFGAQRSGWMSGHGGWGAAAGVEAGASESGHAWCQGCRRTGERWPKQRPEDWRRPGCQSLGWRPRRRRPGRSSRGGRAEVGASESRCGGWATGGGRAEAGASESQCGRQATGGGRTGREWRQWARGSWQHGSELSERERGRGTRRFFGYDNNFHRPPPADGSYVNFCRLAHQLCLEPMKIIVADKKLCFSYSDGLWSGAPPGGWQ